MWSWATVVFLKCGKIYLLQSLSCGKHSVQKTSWHRVSPTSRTLFTFQTETVIKPSSTLSIREVYWGKDSDTRYKHELESNGFQAECFSFPQLFKSNPYRSLLMCEDKWKQYFTVRTKVTWASARLPSGCRNKCPHLGHFDHLWLIWCHTVCTGSLF